MSSLNAKSLLTPKELADAIGASESSLRRWVDAGDIRIARTAGGHRRIPLAEAIRFIRQMGAPVLRPELLGLGDFQVGASGVVKQPDEAALFDRLLAGDVQGARALLGGRFLEGQMLSALFDGPVCAALARLGELWRHEERGILIEHRATEICVEGIGMLRGLLPAADGDAPLALGGAPQGDPYQLPTMMVGAVLAEAGFRDVNFGANTPVELLAKEAIDRRARLVWVSVSTPHDLDALGALLKMLAVTLEKHGIDLVLGGRHHLECAPRHQRNVHRVGSMRELSEMARRMTDDVRGAANEGAR